MTENIRKAYLDFFKSKGHTIVPSDSLVPSSDPTLLFTSAGMVQFKAHFLQQIPLTFTRAASSQRCLRTTDIDNIGLTARHLTFFEMLGNFSFGDYFKEDAIAWAWEFFTKTLALDEKRLWVSVFRDDDEAAKLWKKHVPESRIVRMGEESNFWTMGPTGPCGPCSEIYWDRGDTPSTTGPDDSDRWMEIWNLVFTQFDRQTDGKLLPLPKKNIDTGMGLERLTSVVENVVGNFDTTLIRPLVKFAEDTFGYKYGSDPKKDISVRIVADHLRAVTFLIYDGILPSNEGRGYVLRRLLRRATRQGTLFGRKEPFLNTGVSLVAQMMKDTAVDLPARTHDIALRIREEEERFLETIDSGSQRLKELIDTASTSKSKKVLGADVFRLYDTYGFPPELTREMLAERGLGFDENEFAKAKSDAQTMAREGWKGSGAQDVTIYNTVVKENGTSKFLGYETLSITTPVVRMLKAGQFVNQLKSAEIGDVIAAETPFYPEGGGQVGDKGWLRNTQGEIVADVLDTQKPVADLIVHVVKMRRDIAVGEKLEFLVDKNLREPTQRHHTATHLLHAALRNIIGKTVTQAGSLVQPERLRFDYTHNKPLTKEQIETIEDQVNGAVLHNFKVTPKVFSADEAKKMGAMALFGEKYGDNVRVLLVSNKGYDAVADAFSVELCGGTHVSATGDIGAFKILSDSSLAAGVRRIEAVAGQRTVSYLRNIENKLHSISDRLKTSPDDADGRVAKLIEKQKQLEQEIRDLKLKAAQGGGASSGATSEVQNVNGVQLAVKVVDGLDSKELRTLVDRLKEQLKSGVIFAASTINDEGREKISFVFAVTPDLKPNGLDAGKLAKSAAAELNGSGGGRADFAQGGGEGNARLQALLAKLPSLLK
jgi:alanyl-tRNA synthetase